MSKIKQTLSWGAILIVSVIVIVLAVQFRDQLSHLQTLGLFGIFLANLLGAAVPFVPVPGIVTVVAGGMLYSPFLVALVSTIGAIIGDFLCYFIGLSGEKLFIKDGHGFYKHLVSHMSKYGAFVIFLFAFIPNPIFDAIGIIAGLLNYSPRKFLLWLFIGRFIRNLLLAYLGANI